MKKDGKCILDADIDLIPNSKGVKSEVKQIKIRMNIFEVNHSIEAI